MIGSSDTMSFQLPPRLSARRTFYVWQIIAIGILVISWLCLFFYNSHLALVASSSINLLLTSSVGIYLVILVSLSLKRTPPGYFVTSSNHAFLRDEDLPPYTVLVPLYKESKILSHLLRNLLALDYPKDKLDIILLLEHDDAETQIAVKKHPLPSHFRVLLTPRGYPRTKPRACNAGLALSRGHFLVVYDAEDRPEPDQLKKSIAAFSALEDRVACLQCRLNFYNPRQNILTRLFTLDYYFWFDLFLPSLSAYGFSVPLGGTSNHFRVPVLKTLGGWDAFNVTEDCDLGIRLARSGYQTLILDSTTWEEANSQIRNWLRQRSRWIKGYLQTYLVHMRNPCTLFRTLGFKSFVSFQITVGGTPFVLLLNLLYWLWILGYTMMQISIGRQLFAGYFLFSSTYTLGFTTFILGNLVFFYCSLCGAIANKDYDLVKYVLCTPIYLIFHGVAAWKGCYELLTKPHHWEKTTHGLFN